MSARRDGAGRQAAPDPRRRDPRLRARGLPPLPRVGHRARGQRRLRARLPLLPVQGRGARHALHRALEPAARGDRRGRPQRRCRCARSCARSPSFIIDSYQQRPDLMKVIIVEVTRAANTFGRAHLTRSARPTTGSRAIVAKAQEDGTFRTDISAEFATPLLLRRDRAAADAPGSSRRSSRATEEFEQAKQMLVETVCDGLAVRVGRQRLSARTVTARGACPSAVARDAP